MIYLYTFLQSIFPVLSQRIHKDNVEQTADFIGLRVTDIMDIRNLSNSCDNRSTSKCVLACIKGWAEEFNECVKIILYLTCWVYADIWFSCMLLTLATILVINSNPYKINIYITKVVQGSLIYLHSIVVETWRVSLTKWIRYITNSLLLLRELNFNSALRSFKHFRPLSFLQNKLWNARPF